LFSTLRGHLGVGGAQDLLSKQTQPVLCVKQWIGQRAAWEVLHKKINIK